MYLIITMAGLYQRFEDFSLNVPKYLLPYKSRSIFFWVLKNYSNYNFKKIILLINKRDISFINLINEDLKNLRIKNFEKILIENTSSQIETTHVGLNIIKTKIEEKHAIVVTNVDTILINRNFKIYKNLMKKYDCVVDIFESNNKSYSYVLFDKKNNLINFKEKVVISNSASSGLYIFKNINLLKDLVKKAQNSKNRYFSELINSMIKSKYKVTHNNLDKKKHTIVLGTPEEYLSELQKN